MQNLRCPAALRQSVALILLAAACAAGQAQKAPAAPASSASAPAGPTVRPEMVAPLKAAQDFLAAKQNKEALAKVMEAEALPNPAPYEAYVISRLKAASALGANELAVALPAFEKALASEHLPAAERMPLLDVAVRLALQLKDQPRSIDLLNRYKAAGGTDQVLRRMLPQVLAETNDFNGAVREGMAIVQADEAAGKPSAETLLRNIAFSQNKLGNDAGYVAILERLAVQYPSTDFWAELIGRAERKPGFNGERLRMDAYRLYRAAGVDLDASELADMAQRAQLAGLPAESQALLNEGYASGLLGKGKDAAAVQKLRDQANKAASQDLKALAESEKAGQAAKEGTALVNLGFAMSGAGQHDKALSLMEQGFAKGSLRRPEEAQLHLGVAQWRAGKKDEAKKTFDAIKGGEGAGDLAHVWSLFVSAPPAAKAKP